jgi:endoglucanase
MQLARVLSTLSLVGVVGACHATGTPTTPNESTAPSGPVAPVHDPFAVPRPPVKAVSEPLPGFTRGMNLGNGFDAPSEGEWGVVLTEAHFEHIAAAGFDHVRLPVRFSAHAAKEAPYTIDEAFFRRIDWALEQAAARGLSIIVDLHHYEEIHEAPEAHTARFLALWRQIAQRYADRPATVAFELLNEPCKALSPEKWNPILAQAIAVVRESNPERIVLVDSYFWAASDYLGVLALPDDANVVATFHMYQPILFSHQGAPWMGPEYGTVGVVFPGPPATPLEPVPAAAAVGWVKDWFAAYNRDPVEINPSGPKTVFAHFATVESYLQNAKHRVYLGEFAAVDKADLQSRANFLRLVREEAERRHIGWAYWDDGGMNRVLEVRSGQWVEPLRAALLGGDGSAGE